MPESLTAMRNEIVGCRACPRLVEHREKVAREKRRAYRDWDYWGRPVPALGSSRARLVLVGLAPGAHGSNRTGRIFTGDASGDFLYAALHRFGFASQPESIRKTDGLRLIDCFITAVARCAPPMNRPARGELAACRDYLIREIGLLRRARVWVALGRVAYEELLLALSAGDSTAAGRAQREGSRRGAPRFAHGAEWVPADWRERGFRRPVHLLCSYHPSRQNTQTGRLTRPMFDRIFARAREILGAPPGPRGPGD